ncbi:MAG: AMP-binding protein [Solirubrobacteraceae bacterium]
MSGANLAGLIDGPARWHAGGPAIVVGDEVVRDWAAFAGAVARRAGGLRDRLGVGPGDAVALFAANASEYLEALFAIWHAGAVAVPISSRLHAREAADLLDASRARACLVTADVADALAATAPSATAVVALDDRALLGEAIAPVRRAPGDDAWIFFTSGTTGRAKGARISHANLLAMAAAYHADVAAVGPDDAILHVAALSHASGLFSLPFVARGGPQVLPASGRFDAAEVLELVARHRRSTFFVPPTLLRRLCEAPALRSADVERIATVLVGAAPVHPDDLRAGVAALGPRLWNGYGQGETPLTITAHGCAAIAAAVADGDEDALRSVGVARWATRVRVVDADAREAPAGEVGEVVVDGPTVMAGYLAAPEATARTLRGGWLHTGDLGRFDDAGRLTLVDRAKDVVITGGNNVYPREVEDVLVADPAVAEVAVVGRADPQWGERLVAFVVAAPGQAVDAAALDARCLARIARHKRPREYVVVDELPRNAAGKVLKAQLREGAGDGAR